MSSNSSEPEAGGKEPVANKAESAPARVTMRDIANAVGVTAMTVSRALRNRPQVTEALRERIQEKARELGYMPDPMLAALSRYRQGRVIHPVGTVMAWLNRWPEPEQLRSYQEFERYWQGASRAAEIMGYHLEEFIVNEQMTLPRLEKILIARGIRGVLIPPPRSHELWDEIDWGHFSAVRLGSQTNGLPIHSVSTDQVANTLLAITKMREHGYKRIGFVGNKWRTRLFGAGYLWSQIDLAVNLRLRPLFLPGGNFHGNEKAFRTWFEQTRPDAILTEDAELPRMLARLGMHAPRDIGLAALSVLDCPIDAGIYQNPEEVGRVGVLMLHSLIGEGARGIPSIPHKSLIQGRWVNGSSLLPQT